MQKTKIEWCDYTWNPITGCRRGCQYCYAKRIHDRFNKFPFSEIHYHPERTGDPDKIKKPSVIFVGSMSDISYWSKEQKENIIDKCRWNSHHTFMFLSKDSMAYHGHCWPMNTMQGLTVVTNTHHDNFLDISDLARFPRPYLSIEPLMGFITYSPFFDKMEKIIVGAMTGPKAIEPKPEWIKSIENNVPADKIFWKSNIKAARADIKDSVC